MKRKDYEDKYDNFSSIYLSSPSAKSRRLDPDLLPLTNEDPISSGISDSEVVEPLTSSRTTDDLGLASRPPSAGGVGDCCNEKALVLYSPTNTLFFKSPTSPDFSFVVNSDLIPGLRDQFILLGNSNMVRPMKDALIAKDKITDISDDRLAVVPWVGTRAGPQAAGMSATMEAEVEMMDTDDDSGGSGTAAIPAGGAAGGAGGLQQLQREHCLRPELVQNTCTPVTW